MKKTGEYQAPPLVWKRTLSGKWIQGPKDGWPSKRILAEKPRVISGVAIPAVQWKTRLTGPSFSLVADVDNVFIANGPNVNQYVFRSGSKGIISATANVIDLKLTKKSVVCALADGTLQSYSRKTSALEWKSSEADIAGSYGLTSFPSGWLVSSEVGSVLAFDAVGQPLWRFNPPDGSLGMFPSMSMGRGVYVSGETHIYRIDEKNGRLIWKSRVAERGTTTPAVALGLVFVAGTQGGITCLDATTGKVRWNRQGLQHNIGDESFVGVAIVGIVAVAMTTQGGVWAYNLETGKELWRRHYAESFRLAPEVDVKRRLLIIYGNTVGSLARPELLGIDVMTGKIQWTARVGKLDAMPVIVGDRIWVASSIGTLYAFYYG